MRTNHYASRYIAAGLAIAATGILVTGLTGCGQSDGIERRVVSGSVTVNGEPIEKGRIRFMPTAGTKAPASGAPIENGQYKVDTKGGVPVGTHRVEITAYRPRPGMPPGEEIPGMQGDPGEQYLPPKFNSRSELMVELESGGGPVTEDFELTP